jgi:D-arabinose 1-dehydrogenase-like Zn-dependent alcohol dehydrogenase
MTAMKAIVVKEIGAVGFMEKPVPTAGQDDAIIRAALVCTSDSHTAGGGVGVVAEVGSALERSVSTKWKEPWRWRTSLRTW